MEIYKDIEGYEDHYQISNQGNVRSLKHGKSKILSSNKDGRGYLKVNLCKNNVRKIRTIHHLVSMSFLGFKPDGTLKKIVDHINNDKTDNRLENLQLISQRENASKDKIGSSIYTGVCFHKQSKKWEACINVNNRLKYLGLYSNEIDASNAYQEYLKSITNN